MNKIGWNPIETAPKTGEVILVMIDNYPGISLATWNAPNQEWCIAILNIGMYLGEYNDTYFENEYFDDSDLIGWSSIK